MRVPGGISTRPLSACNSPARMRRSVVFPEPFTPASPTGLPALTTNDTPERTVRPPSSLLMDRITSTQAPGWEQLPQRQARRNAVQNMVRGNGHQGHSKTRNRQSRFLLARSPGYLVMGDPAMDCHHSISVIRSQVLESRPVSSATALASACSRWHPVPGGLLTRQTSCPQARRLLGQRSEPRTQVRGRSTCQVLPKAARHGKATDQARCHSLPPGSRLRRDE